MAAAADRFGRLDALCNIAGIIKFANSHEMAAEDYLRTIAINLNAPFFLSQAAIPHLLQSGMVRSSTAHPRLPFIGEAYATAYCASKAGHREHDQGDGDGIFAQADPHQRGRARRHDDQHRRGHDRCPKASRYDLIQRYSGLRGLVEVEDVADLIALLASPAGRSYHGACISIDAGITAG